MECAEAADALGYTTLCAYDRILFAIPWRDRRTQAYSGRTN
jgi:hypothetical protein